MKYLGLIGLFIAIGGRLAAQSITVYQDTIICSNDTIPLYAVVDGSYGTETYTVESIPYAPETIGGASMTMVDDTYIGSYPIGFDFCFFGEFYDDFYIASNGWISFVLPGAGWATNWTPDDVIPDNATNVPKTAIMPMWTDWHTGLCSNCIHRETVGTAPFRKTIITYEDVPLFSCTGFEGTFQIVLYETTNVIEHHLWDVDVCAAWDLGIATQGIHNQTGTEAYVVPGRNATAWDATDESWRFSPASITWYDLTTGAVIGTGDSVLVSPDVTNSYYAEVVLCDGSIYTDTVTVTIAAPFTVDSVVQQIDCFGDNNGSVTLTVTGNSEPITFNWSNGSTNSTVNDLGPGTYTVTIEEEGGCIINLEFDIIEPPLLTLDVVDYQDITCFGGNDGFIYLDPEGGVPPYIFISGGTVLPDSNLTTLEAGTYEIVVQDMHACTDTVIQILVEPIELEVDAGDNLNIPFGGTTTIDASSNATVIASVTWLPTDGLSCTDCLNPDASPDFTTTYQVTLVDENGCIATDEVTINVILDFTVPNAFTPNGDGLNDLFQISADFLESVTLEVFNRWGDLVYRSEELGKGWDGTFDGSEQEIGTYIYKVNAVTISGQELIKTGTVSLLR
jgi:gliding motility-associated-like protein